MKRRFCSILSLVLLALPLHAADQPTAKTLRSFGAVGDGRTDDRAAIEKALIQSSGAALDGEGLTYAVHGNIEVNVSADFSNATLVQTMESADVSQYIPSVKGGTQITTTPENAFLGMVKGLPHMTAFGLGTYSEDPVLTDNDLKKVLPSIALRTLSFAGKEDKPISVRLSKVIIQRGNHPDSGGRSDGAGISIQYATPVKLTDVEVTGDGKGYGILVKHCNQVDLLRLNIHDIRWAPYQGDADISMESIKEDFGWNEYPIYEYRSATHRFVRVRIQEQLSGLFVVFCNDVRITDSTIARLQAKIGDKLIPLQVDGMTINRVTHLLISNCHVSFVWEGIDFTGAAGDDFVYENVHITDIFSWAFKFAHPKSNGKVNNCVAERAGMAGFLIGSETDNISYNNCTAIDTGSNGYWTRANGQHFQVFAGFRIDSEKDFVTPRLISLNHCAAINTQYKGAMDYGFYCGPNAVKHQISMTDCKAEGAKIKDFFGFAEK